MNRQIWEMYKSSERGKEVINLFSFYKDREEEAIPKMEEIIKRYVANANIEVLLSNFFLVMDNVEIDNLKQFEQEEDDTFFERFIDNFELCWIEEDNNGNLNKSIDSKDFFIKKGQYRKVCGIMNVVSLYLYTFYDGFYPILDAENFNVFVKNCDILEIDLPQIPNSKDKRGRLIFYWELCKSLNLFAKENNLSSEECCACIYDYATILQDEIKEIVSDMPEPTNIWFTGGDKTDYKTTLQNLTNETVADWACNEATKRGDIIVLYCLSPHSYIHSIWRANKDGVVNPFNYYYGRTSVTNPIVIEPINIKELKSDEYWSQLPIVRKNLQGINGVELSAQDYDELLRMLKTKGFDTSKLPKLYSPDINLSKNIKAEKDVEEMLLIPLLKELGYSDKDWERQLVQKAGRGLKAIPDFVFFPKGEKHFQNASMIIEAKFYMRSANEKMNAFNQALSYCKMMSSEILVLCDKERLIIYKREKGLFDRFNPIFEKHWESIKEKAIFLELKKIIGKEVVESI